MIENVCTLEVVKPDKEKELKLNFLPDIRYLSQLPNKVYFVFKIEICKRDQFSKLEFRFLVS